jgi:hypothetical protein
MNLRSIALIGAATTCLAPGLSRAADPCEIPIYVFSFIRHETGIQKPAPVGGDAGSVPSATSSAVGCVVVKDTVQPGDDAAYLYNTDLIYPGSNVISVRLFENGRDPSAVTEATLTIGDEVVPLVMEPGTDVAGAAQAWLDSKPIEVDPTRTAGPLTVTAHFCIEGGTFDDFCYDRTYNTPASHPLPA